MPSRDRLKPSPALPVLLLALALAAALAPAAAQSTVSGRDRVVRPPEKGAAVFRFLPGGSYSAFDRSLELSAAPGELREYQLQVSTEAGAPVFDYVIDKRRPAAVRAEPGTGLYRSPLKVRLSSEPGAAVYWALVGPQGSTTFIPYGEGSEPVLSPPAAGTVTYSILSYAVDPAGNRSYPSRFVYRLAEPGLGAAAPAPESWGIKADPSLPEPEMVAGRGYVELRMKLASGSSLLLDIQPEGPPLALDEFERVASQDGNARLRIPCPYGWQGRLVAYFGVMKAGLASFNPTPLSIVLSNPAEEAAPIAVPAEPQLLVDPSRRAAFALFSSYDGQIFVSIEGADVRPYEGPLALPLEKPSVQVSWYGVDAAGRRSGLRSLALPLPDAAPEVGLSGIVEGATVGGDIILRPEDKAVLRYELRLDGSLPPEPTASSPLVGESLSIACPPGAERSIVLRYRAFSGSAGGEGRILRFSIDRKPPEAPSAQAVISTYYDKPASLDLKPGAGAMEIFAAVSVDGVEEPFSLVKGRLEFPGSDAGPVGYTVRAYDVDAVGNRSPEMKSFAFVVDKSSVYVSNLGAEGTGDRGDGSPDRPYRSLIEALSAALKLGKKSVNMRGFFELGIPLLSSSDLSLKGGFGPRWIKDPASRAKIAVKIAKGSSTFEQSGGSLSFQKVDISEPGAGAEAIFKLKDASLSFEDSSLSASGEGELLFVSALRSQIALEGSKFKAGQALACTMFSSDSSEISMTGSSVVAEGGVRIFGAFDMDGGALALQECLVESHSDLGVSLFSLRSASLLVDRSLMRVDGGSGFMRLGSFSAVRGELKNSKVFLAWKGPGTLFEIAEGGPTFRHDTIVADSAQGGLRFFDVRGRAPEVWNSILACRAPGSELMRSSTAVGQGVLVADCLWGFDRLIAGEGDVVDLKGLNALNAASALYSSKPVIAEPPERTFAAPVKNQASLRGDSACVNAALPLEGFEIDFSGHPRPGPGHGAPDIGAEEAGG